MSDSDVLKKAVQKAIDNGWLGFNVKNKEDKLKWYTGPSPVWFLDNAKYYDDIRQFASPNGTSFELNGLIFNHDFARALWGDTHFIGGTTAYPLVQFEEHLSQMVISDDPIKYLGDNI